MEKKEETNNNKEERNNEGKEEDRVPQMALNHVSRLCRDVKESIDFYSKVLGLVLIERPPAFEFDGAWLFNYGVGVHLIQAKDEDSLPKTDRVLDPRDNHISFQVIDSILWLSDNHMHSFTHIFLYIQDFFYMYFCQF